MKTTTTTVVRILVRQAIQMNALISLTTITANVKQGTEENHARYVCFNY